MEKITQRCCTCKIIKLSIEFGINNRRSSGLQARCKQCFSKSEKRRKDRETCKSYLTPKDKSFPRKLTITSVLQIFDGKFVENDN